MKSHIKVLSALLAAALVLTGCLNPLEPPPEPGPEGAYAEVRIETPFDSTARTIYPVLPGVSRYELTFSGPEAREPLALNSGGPHLVALAAGNWTITATAFTGTEGAAFPLARGSASVTVNIGQTAPANITLSPVSGEAGSFRYAITLPPGATGNLVVTTAEGGTISGGTINLQSGALTSGVLNLPTGQYLMNIGLSLGDRRAGRTEALHIYPYQESPVEYCFFEHDFRLVGNLTYNRWEEQTLGPGEVRWYTFSAAAGAAYRVQWNGAAPQGDGTKTLPAVVSAYTGDNTFIFENKTTGWVSPEAVSGVQGAVYLRVQGADGADAGSYALRYYNPAELPPQEGINLSVNALPVPRNIVTWNTVPGAAGYRLYRTTDPAAGYNQIGGDLSGALYTDTLVLSGVTYHYRVSAYNALGEGEKSPMVSASPPPAVSLTETVWAEGTLNAGEAQWYTFTAAAGAAYRVQWNGAAPQGDGSKTLPAVVSAYTGDGGLVFGDKTEGWTAPETLSGLDGIVYLKVEGAGGAGGSFAVWYYDPVTTPPAVLYVGSAANPEPSITSLEGAFTWLNANVANNTAYTIIVYQNTAMPARTLGYSGKTNVSITIKGNGSGRIVQLSGTGSLFTVSSNVTLAVENITLRGQGNTSETGNTDSLVAVNGTLEMRRDSLITRNYRTSDNGGGVYVYSGGSFTMQDNASVSNNTALYYGGGVYVQGGSFTMEDNASVSGNTVSFSSSGGGGVYFGSSGTFTMQDNALVSGNTARYGGGVYVMNGTFLKKGGAIYGDTDTTYTEGSTENTATSGNGHAVYLHLGKKRNSTAGTTVNLYAQYSDGAWTYEESSAGGVGDTTANWE
ncbi:MAG: hypothetical protein LBQ14_12315 [Treponema sp.]|jgi:hypothetical protein|nr:hypothetical protein [Treponema sp.]